MSKKKFFNDLKEAMQDAIAHQRGESELESRTFTIPEPPAKDKLEVVDSSVYNPPAVHGDRK
jgi:hypothetical protein